MSQANFNVSEFLDRQRFGAFHLLVVTLCTCSLFIDGYDTFVIAYTNVPMAKAFGVEPHAFTIAVVLQVIGVSIGSYVMSWIADRRGRRVVLLWCTLIFGLLMLLTSLSTSVIEFASIRFFAGLFLGGVYPNAIAIAGEIAPYRNRSTVISITGAGFTLGPAIGAWTSAMIIDSFGWQGIYLGGGAVTLCLVPAFYALLPESIRFSVRRNRRDPRIGDLLRQVNPAVRLTGGEEYALAEQGEDRKPAIRDLFRDGLALRTSFAWATFLLSGLLLALLGTWLPVFFSTTGGLTMERALMLTGIYQTSGLVSQPIVGAIIDRWSAPAPAGALLFTVLAVAIASLGMIELNSITLLPAIVLTGFCSVSSTVALLALATYLYPTRIRSMGVGWNYGINKIGSVVGVMIGGAMLSAHLSLQGIFAVSASFAFPAAFMMAIIWAAQRREERLRPVLQPACTVSN